MVRSEHGVFQRYPEWVVDWRENLACILAGMVLGFLGAGILGWFIYG